MLGSKADWIKGVAHWRAGDAAFISVAFTWRLDEARRIAEYYRALGCSVTAGGPGLFTRKAYLDGLAYVPRKKVMRGGREYETCLSG